MLPPGDVHVPRSEQVQPVAFGGKAASISAEKKVAKSAERPAKKLGVSGDARWGLSGCAAVESPLDMGVAAKATKASMATILSLSRGVASDKGNKKRRRQKPAVVPSPRVLFCTKNQNSTAEQKTRIPELKHVRRYSCSGDLLQHSDGTPFGHTRHTTCSEEPKRWNKPLVSRLSLSLTCHLPPMSMSCSGSRWRSPGAVSPTTSCQ